MEIVAWEVEAEDGRRLAGPDAADLREVRKVAGVEIVVYRARAITARTDDPRFPALHLVALPATGERLRCVNRTAHRLPDWERTVMPFLEVLYPDDRYCRLYLHPAKGPILSTLDLNLNE